jgi:hypothetical protein
VSARGDSCSITMSIASSAHRSTGSCGRPSTWSHSASVTRPSRLFLTSGQQFDATEEFGKSGGRLPSMRMQRRFWGLSVRLSAGLGV